MTDTKITDLLARLESAMEGSGELDIEIARAVYGNDGQYREFTRSLDSALTLVPDEWREHGNIAWPGYEDGVLMADARVDLGHVLSSGGAPRVQAFAATPALALCIAALRARAAESRSEGA